jgi:chromate transporter
MGLAAALLTLWVTFVPCFLWIFAGAPYIEWISTRPRLTGALSAITAAVVGVILNLSLWFGLHVFFADIRLLEAGPLSFVYPLPGSADVTALALAVLAAALLLWRRWPLPGVLALMALAGAAVSLF